MKFLGLDFGDKRIGVAISDEEGRMAFPRGVVHNSPRVFSDIQKMCADERVEKIVLGLPIPFSGKSSVQTEAVKRFGVALEAAAGIPVEYANEIFTTKIGKSDESAAALILQGWLDRTKKEV